MSDLHFNPVVKLTKRVITKLSVYYRVIVDFEDIDIYTTSGFHVLLGALILDFRLL